MDYRELARQIAQEEGVDPDLFTRLVEAESGFRPNVTSSAGAYGLAQLMPGTAQELGVDPRDPAQNLRGGARYLRQQLDRFGDTSLALAAYNAGPGRVQQYGGIPPFEETQNYVARILGDYSGQGGVQNPSQGQSQGVEQFAMGYQPVRETEGMFRLPNMGNFNMLDVYNPYAIAQRRREQ